MFRWSSRSARSLLTLGLGIAVGALGVLGVSQATAQQQATPYIAWNPPPGVVKISECVPTMGEHWANPANLPMGPIYTVYNGRLDSIEYMPGQDFFAQGRSADDLPFTYWGQQLPINHVDIDFQPHGHEGYQVPHYDMHFHIISHAEDRAETCQPPAPPPSFNFPFSGKS